MQRYNGTNYTLRLPFESNNTCFQFGIVSSRIFLAVNVWRRLSVQMIDILTFRNFGKCSLFLRHFDRNRAADYNYFIPNTKYQISMALKKENLKSDKSGEMGELPVEAGNSSHS